MLWIILTIVLVIIGVGGLLVGMAGDAPGGYVTAGCCTLAWIVLTLILCLHTVGQREVGIVYSFSGTITGKKDSGVVFTAPWQHIKKENIGIQHEEYDLDRNNSAVSNDQQPIFARLAVNLQVDPEKVVDLYKRIGPSWKSILLESRVLQDFKEVTATFPTADITNRREQLRVQTKERLTEEMARYDIKIIDVFVRNIGFSEAYSNAIEQKLVQQQKALRAQFKADAVKKEALGDAYAIRVKGAALRANPQSLQEQAIKALGPKVQLIVCTGRTCPAFIPANVLGTGTK